MHPILSGCFLTVAATAIVSIGVTSVLAEDPYLPFNSNGTLIVPEETPKPTTVNSPPTYELPNQPSRSTIPETTTPAPGSSAPVQSSPAPAQLAPAQSLMTPAPTVVTPGMMMPYQGPQPYWTGFRGRPGWGPFSSWTQQTYYGPMMYGNPCAPNPCAPVNYEFGRGYDGFLTGW